MVATSHLKDEQLKFFGCGRKALESSNSFSGVSVVWRLIRSMLASQGSFIETSDSSRFIDKVVLRAQPSKVSVKLFRYSPTLSTVQKYFGDFSMYVFILILNWEMHLNLHSNFVVKRRKETN